MTTKKDKIISYFRKIRLNDDAVYQEMLKIDKKQEVEIKVLKNIIKQYSKKFKQLYIKYNGLCLEAQKKFK